MADIKTDEQLSASEALFGFAAWLTTRSRRVTASGMDEAGIWAELVGEFCRVNNLEEPRPQWVVNLTHPPEGPWGELVVELDSGPISSQDWFDTLKDDHYEFLPYTNVNEGLSWPGLASDREVKGYYQEQGEKLYELIKDDLERFSQRYIRRGLSARRDEDMQELCTALVMLSYKLVAVSGTTIDQHNYAEFVRNFYTALDDWIIKTGGTRIAPGFVEFCFQAAVLKMAGILEKYTNEP